MAVLGEGDNYTVYMNIFAGQNFRQAQATFVSEKE